MVARILIIASVASVFNLANGLSALFPGFKPCKTSDDACILQNTNVGIEHFVGGLPDFGIKSSDPDYYERVDCSTPNLKFILSHVTLTGLKNCKAVKAKRDEANLQMTLVFECTMKLEGDYEMAGQALFTTIEGADKVRVEIPKMVSTIICNYIYKEGKDGKKHIRIKNFEHNYELKEKATLVFEGLFPDNEVLRAATNQVLKDSPNEVINEIGTKMFQTVMKRKVEDLNKLFTVMPYAELALD